MKRRNRLQIFIGALILLAFFMLSCSGKKEEGPQSLEQIQKEQGIPVVVKPVVAQRFEKSLSFFGTFRGERETIVGAMIGGRVQKINYKPGDKVQKDAVVIEFPEDSPGAQFRQAKSAYELSKKTYERMKALFEKGEIAQAQFDGARTKYLVDKSNYETMKDLLKLDAPYSGTITEVMVHEGDNVKSKTPLFAIAKLNKMKIRVWISDAERQQIKPGMKALATVEGRTFTGKVQEISIGVNPMKQAFYADLIFDKSNGEILPGTTADVKIITYEDDHAIVLPIHLLRSKDGRKFVFLARDGHAKEQPVTISNDNGVYFEISSGLKEGDPLIIKGYARLADGVKIKVVR